MNSEQSNRLHRELITSCIIQTCLNCEYFDEKPERCSLAPTYPLPAKVVVFGCPKWIPLIPF